ncbi:Glutathione import ATP-binding protein GsiA [Pelagimonas phthalicica]|uniref:Glutathione import ATP-binding protein GsiA n=1 Tax=Pelagimonas phthalicica TaxID=1037362 RepID=A0A238J904_9RHOB|nr:ABC transporter ATP-binding protein [Pelagimonas phthalicica]TDS95042.1 peptide/nickel transport system ATP-binding protein/glutathione transport system ATP-binding protein [Pelagimonas phthalicica]SMX26432.1 Glutathione import ATP-binding protein GsiA [Pelagimonas phthalicica]
MRNPENLLEIENLKVSFQMRNFTLDAVKGIDLSIKPGEVVGVVGESGSGKSLTARAILNLMPRTAQTAGSVKFKGRDGVVSVLDHGRESRTMRELRGGQIGMIFQEPMTALSPVHSIGQQVMKTLTLHTDQRKKALEDRAAELMDLVQLPDPRGMLKKYPHQLSGGMRQRAMIAMALSCNPSLLLADEPTTALDVTTEAQILNLIRGLQEQFNMGVMFITHNFGVVAELADRVTVMNHGIVEETGTIDEIFYEPKAAYTQKLLSLIPRLPEYAMADNVEAIPAQPAAFSKKADEDVVLKVENLKMYFPTQKDWRGRVTEQLKAVDDVSFTIRRGETFGLVGESGSGKSTVARAILRAYQPTAGTVSFQAPDGNFHELTELQGDRLRRMRAHMQMVFQDPYSSLNPRMTVEQLIGEPMVNQGETNQKLIREKAAALLHQVGLKPDMLSRYPHAFSGGQRQRIGIARALVTNPSFVVLDESVSALDVSIAAQTIDLLRELQETLKLTYLFITHDLSMIANFADNIGVMQKGKLVEAGDTVSFFANPREAYSRRLLNAVPIPDPRRARRLQARREKEALSA